MPIHLVENDLNAIAKAALFANIERAELPKILDSLNTKISCYKKDDYIIRGGDQVKRFVIILEGRLLILCEGKDGLRTILTDKQKDEIFGADLSLSKSSDDISIIAAGDCRVLIIDLDKIFWDCTVACSTHKQLLYNLVEILSDSNIRLIRKFRHVSQHSLRKKIVSFLSEQLEFQSSRDFEINFDRQEMADYLGADRSALSAELSRMRKEGLLDFRKNHFLIKEPFFQS